MNFPQESQAIGWDHNITRDKCYRVYEPEPPVKGAHIVRPVDHESESCGCDCHSKELRDDY